MRSSHKCADLRCEAGLQMAACCQGRCLAVAKRGCFESESLHMTMYANIQVKLTTVAEACPDQSESITNEL
jgi:hypothetical protein